MIAAVSESTETVRGQQLAALRALRLTTMKAGNTTVSGAAAKAMLRSIDDHGQVCWASVETLAGEACLDARTARRAIQALASTGLITVTEKPGASKTIVINWDAVAAPTTPDTMSPRTPCPPGHHVPPDILTRDPGHHVPPPRTP